MNGATRALVLVTAVLAIAPNAGAQDTDGAHRVRSGDTLWDLAARYLADPFRWPELYELNVKVVEDPHWIFPGETILLPGGRAAAVAAEPSGARQQAVPRAPRAEAEARPAQEATGDASRSFGPTGQFPEGSVFRADPSAPSYGQLSIAQKEASAAVSLSDFYGAPILADKEAFVSAGVTARVVAEAHPDIKLPLTARRFDEVVLHLSGADVDTGDFLKAVQWGRELGTAGHVLYTVGAVRVTRTYPTRDSARAEVIQVHGNYRVGDLMVMADEYPIVPGVEAVEEVDGLVGTVLGFAEDQTLLGTGEVLFLDIGASAGVAVGDVFAIFPAASAAETALMEDRLTTVRVTRTTDVSSTARVTEVRDAGMRPGAPVRRVERMPR